MIAIGDSDSLPVWRRPEALLIVMTVAMALTFNVWMALLNNFAVEAAQFDGSDIGWMQTIREIPGFLAFGAVYALLFMREQTLAYVSLLLLAIGAALTGFLPSFWGLALTTMVSSIGYHYFETVNQSLQLQWLSKTRAPQMLGNLRAIGAGVAFIVFAVLLYWGFAEQGSGAEVALDYRWPYLISGLLAVALIVAAMFLYPRFESPHVQRRELVLRSRYWLYYALVFMSGARRQIFLVFATFMLVEKFGYALHHMAALLLLNQFVTMLVAPFVGQLIIRFGERNALTLEYAGLTFVFLGYAFIYYVDVNPLWAAFLYIADHIFFSMSFAVKTYFQKIADPSDHAPTAAVAFTINHIAAVFLPAGLGYLYLVAPSGVFVLGATMAVVSLILARMIPRHPDDGMETVFARPAPQTAAAE